jgi:hypothetical protein
MNADNYQNRVKHSSIKLPAYRLNLPMRKEWGKKREGFRV